MKTKKLISMLVAAAMLTASAVSAFAYAPEDYDSNPYESVGYTSEDPDGEINLAVIASGDVTLNNANTMYVKGSIYSNGTIYVGNGAGNVVDGLFISGTGDTTYSSDTNYDEWTEYRTAEGYVHVDSNTGTTDGINYWSTAPEFEGAIYDAATAVSSVSYEAYTAPEITNTVAEANGNQWWPGAVTVSEDTHFENFTISGQGLYIDTTAGDVTIVIDNFKIDNTAEIIVKGGNKVNLYILNSDNFSNFNITLYNDAVDYWNLPGWNGREAAAYDYKNAPEWASDPVDTFFNDLGDADQVNLYLGEADDVISINGSHICGDVYSNAASLTVAGAAKIKGNVYTGAEDLHVTNGGTYIYGSVYAPKADTIVEDSGIIIGQLYTDTLNMNGTGQIVYKADTAAQKSEVEVTPDPTEEPTPEPEPTEEPTPEPTKAPVPTGKEIDLTGTGYAYIFGYEPDLIERVSITNDEGNEIDHYWNVEIRMAPQDNVTREQVAAMIMRMIDQKYDNLGASYAITDNIASHAGTWYERGLAYIASTGAFDDVDEVYTGAITRGEVAKLVAFGLNLSDTTETEFTDIADSEYKAYIEIMNAYGYMQGISDTEFEPDRVMTRAEFCSMFNQIIDRQDALLETPDGTVVTPATYYFTDLDANAWYTPVMLRATSAYDEDGYVDLDTRLANIRNTLDNYDSQKLF